MKVSIILGTRPEIIKMSPVIRQLQSRSLDFYIIHTGQHYSYNMDKIFFDQLHLPNPHYNLDVGSGTHGRQTGLMLEKIEDIFIKNTPDIILVQGDTNTVLAAALVASKMGIKIGHIEAGLRSFDRSMPEETNRVITDHLSDYLFAPTEIAKNNLLHEGIDDRSIFVCGNTVVDAVMQNLDISKKDTQILEKYGISKNNYFLITAHRQENVDQKSKLIGIIQGLKMLYEEYGIPILFPAHPRTQKNLHQFGIPIPDGTIMFDPPGYLEFLQLEENAKLILTDSGGVQEESCILGVPTVTLRENTERPETIHIGANMIVGTDPNKIIQGVRTMILQQIKWINPFGDGNAGKRIVDTIIEGKS
ncbi:non-hydrolyzing UDP-N-acetylglucosamine 2-epimerase [Methanofollis sp. UBA420]|uniref:non-hydrolyzing UDP-N-acetylglucosamine 2-epimerase n=1 Tax=Methanofollis sp. UBA420 TaxID=1915514 RepID=UPI00316AEA0B